MEQFFFWAETKSSRKGGRDMISFGWHGLAARLCSFLF